MTGNVKIKFNDWTIPVNDSTTHIELIDKLERIDSSIRGYDLELTLHHPYGATQPIVLILRQQRSTLVSDSFGISYINTSREYNCKVEPFSGTLEQQKKEFRKSIETLEQNNTSLVRRLSETSSDLARQRMQYTTLNRDFTEVKKNKCTTEDEVKQLRTQLKSALEERTTLADVIQQLKSEIKKLSNTNEEVTILKNELARMKKASADSIAECDRKWALKLKEQDKIVDNTKVKLTKDLATAQTAAREHEGARKLAEAARNTAEMKCIDAEKAYADANKALKESQEKINKMESSKQANQGVVASNQQCPSCTQASNDVRKRMERVQKEVADAQAQLAKTSGDELRKLQAKQQALDKEKAILEQRVSELNKREREHTKMAKEFETKCNEWKKTVEESAAASKKSGDLISEVQEENDQVIRDKAQLADKLAQAEEIKERLAISEKSLKEKVERMQQYIALIERQGLLPEALVFKRLLKAVKHLKQPQVKCFISYAWWPDTDKNAALQAQLLKMKDDLTKTGIEVMLDFSNMDGDIDYYMSNGIQTSYRVLLICTPRLKLRAGDQKQNNLQKELNEALKRQKVDPKFIVPLILEGDRDTSVPLNLPNILSLDFSNPENYCHLMTSLTPKGLIPMLLGLEKNFLYAELLRGYQAQVKALHDERQAITG